MQVREIMTRQPVTDADGKLIGVVTDRDIRIAASTQNNAPSQISPGAMRVWRGPSTTHRGLPAHRGRA